MTPKPQRKLLITISLLYIAEGLPFGVIHDLVPVWLKTMDVSLKNIGLMSLVGLPWTLKFFWAPAVDRMGAASRWISGALLVVAITTALIPTIPFGWPLAAALVVLATASATQDVAIDGYFTAIAPPHLHGRLNGLRVAAYRAALLITGGGAVALGGVLPWWVVFMGLAGIAAALGLFSTRLPPVERTHVPLGDWFRELWGWLRVPGAVSALAFVLFFKVGDAAMGPMVKPFWLDAGLSVEEIGLISISLGAGLTVAGALIGGELTTRWGHIRALWVFGALQALSNVGYAIAASDPSRPLIYAASMIESFTGGLGTAAFLAVLMLLCDRKQSATRFALLTALAGLTRTLAGGVSGFGAEHWGYAGYFTLTFFVALPALALLLPLSRHVRRLER